MMTGICIPNAVESACPGKPGNYTAQVAIGTTNMDYQNFSSISAAYNLTCTCASSGTYNATFLTTLTITAEARLPFGKKRLAYMQ